MGKFESIVQMHLDRGDNSIALGEAARWGEHKMVQTILELGEPVDSRTKEGATPLMLAAAGGSLRCAQLLLDAGADVNAISHERGKTPLVWLMGWPHKERVAFSIAKRLVEAGADTTIRDDREKCVSDWAKERGYLTVIDLLNAHSQD